MVGRTLGMMAQGVGQLMLILVVPRDHPLGRGRLPTLEQIAREKLVVSEPSCDCRVVIEQAFRVVGIEPSARL